MSYKVILSELALKELEDSSGWYEERAIGLGERFITIIDKSFNAISNNPKAYPKKKANYREFIIDKFPYVIVYELVETEHVLYILHVFHTSRNPKLKYRRKIVNKK